MTPDKSPETVEEPLKLYGSEERFKEFMNNKIDDGNEPKEAHYE